MAENDKARAALSTTDAPATDVRPLTSRKMLAEARKEIRQADRTAKRAAESARRRRLQPVRAAGTLAAVCALIAGVAIPAYAATQSDDADTVGVHEQAAGEAQSFEASASLSAQKLGGASYAATSPEEIAQKKAEEEALKRAEEQRKAAAEAQKLAQAQQTSSGAPQVASTPQDGGTPSSATPIDGAYNPLPPGSYNVTRSVYSGGGHDGTDMAAPEGTPIYAVKGGTVMVSSDGHFGWGVTVSIDHGDGTQTLYGHMVYGSRLVQAGETVEAGQQIGQVGNTGRSFGSHLHIELRINGAIVDPLNYLPI
ncbi:peptidoglycan DD-metalloendopeptidase family protein [Microbacterium sp. gxy059]|uniref:M23 family metallopeptidase n=1 Tax=Microbacterium sp. gxy059 TaxID=2957199 RepID=UPI003D97C4CF